MIAAVAALPALPALLDLVAGFVDRPFSLLALALALYRIALSLASDIRHDTYLPRLPLAAAPRPSLSTPLGGGSSLHPARELPGLAQPAYCFSDEKARRWDGSL